MHLTVRSRMLLAFALVALVPLVLYGALVNARSATALREVERRAIVAQASGVRRSLAERVADARADIARWAVSPDLARALASGSPGAVHRALELVRDDADARPDLVAAFLPDGRPALPVAAERARLLWAIDESQAACEGVRTADLENLDGSLYVLAATPVYASRGDLAPDGVLVTGQEIDARFLAEVQRLTGAEGDLAVYTGSSLAAATDPAAATLLEGDGDHQATPDALIARDGRTSRLVRIANKEGETVALLEVSVPRATYRAALGAINAISVAAFLVALGAALATGLLVTRRVIEPLRDLASAAAAMAAGELRQRLPDEGDDEVADLARAFNAMSERVARRIEGLSDKAETLAYEITNVSAFGATLAQTPDPVHDLERLVDMVRGMFDGDLAAIHLVYEGHVTRAAFSGSYRCQVPPPAADELAALAAREGRSLQVTDAGGDGRISPAARAVSHLPCYLVVPLARQEGVVGALTVGYAARREPAPEELPLLATLAGQIAIALQNAEAYEKLDRMYLETVTALAAAMEAKDHYTASHADSLASMAVAVGAEMGMSDAELRQLQYAAVLHDIGKIGIPGAILNKPDRLTPEEFAAMAQHTVIGERIISRIDHLVPIARIIRSAHERWDGRGYPDGLSGEDIPLASRILLVCDAFDAMTSDRPYRKALPVETALRELAANAGTQFDPRVVDVFLAAYPFEETATERLLERLAASRPFQFN